MIPPVNVFSLSLSHSEIFLHIFHPWKKKYENFHNFLSMLQFYPIFFSSSQELRRILSRIILWKLIPLLCSRKKKRTILHLKFQTAFWILSRVDGGKIIICFEVSTSRKRTLSSWEESHACNLPYLADHMYRSARRPLMHTPHTTRVYLT